MNKDIRRDIRKAAKLVRNEIRTMGKDLMSNAETWSKSTRKIVEENAPKVSAALDDTMNRTNDLFSKAMNIVEKQTRETQIDLLQGYKNFLARQVDLIDRRLKKMKK